MRTKNTAAAALRDSLFYGVRKSVKENWSKTNEYDELKEKKVPDNASSPFVSCEFSSLC